MKFWEDQVRKNSGETDQISEELKQVDLLAVVAQADIPSEEWQESNML